MDPTIQALQQLSRLEPASAAVAWQRVDWSRLATLASAGGVAGLVERSLERLELSVPQAARLELAKASLAVEAQNRVVLAEAAELSRAAAERGLTLVPIKGAALLMGRPYTGMAQRGLSDLDLVARRAEYGELERLFGELGLVADAQRDLALRHEHHVRHRREHRVGRLLVELHWTPYYMLYGTPRADEAALARLVGHRFDGVDYALLDAEDTLLSLLLHLAMHRYRGQLKWAVDVLEAICWFEAHGGIDWPELDARAKALGARRAVTLGLRCCAQTLGIEGMLGGPAPAAAMADEDGLRLRLLRRLTPPAGLLDNPPQPVGWQRAAIDLALCDHLLDGLRYLLLKSSEVSERRSRLRLPGWLVRRGLDR